MISLSRIFKSEKAISISLIILVFIVTFLVFKSMQKPVIFSHTLAKITHTYSRDAVKKNVVWKVCEPFYYPNSANICRWDGEIYSGIMENYYDNGTFSYAFFPLFPMLWK